MASFASVGRALAAARAVFLHHAAETDTYFDTPQGLLRRGDCGLRLRAAKLLKAGKGKFTSEALLTYKGPRRRKGPIKRRAEVQTHVADAAACQAILKELGFASCLTVRKRRESYALGHALVTLDELPGVGRFVEIEAPNTRELQRAREALGLPDQPIREHYVALAIRAKRAGKPDKPAPRR